MVLVCRLWGDRLRDFLPLFVLQHGFLCLRHPDFLAALQPDTDNFRYLLRNLLPECVGVAMGGLGSDAAIEAADVVIMNDQPSKLADAVVIARQTRRIVKQNITFILIIKLMVLILGAVGLASMWMAVFADVGVAVLAILNAVRIIRK